MEKAKRNKLILISVIVLALLIAGGAILGFVLRDQKLKATTMRLLRRVNVVTLVDANGKEQSMTDNMKLQNGNALKTEADSMVSVGLDEFKVVTVEEKSRAEFYQTGKKLELNLTEGSLFIDVSQHLADDESFDVRTSTMTAGIRGTTIYVSQNEDGTWTMYLVSGALHIRGYNQKTGEEKERDIVGGQKVTAITFDDRETDTIILQVEEFTEETMPLTLIEELLANKDAMDRAAAESGFDPAKIAALAGVEYESEPETEPQTEATETETTETETESSSEAEENNEPDPEGEGEEVGNEEPAAEDDDGDTGAGGEDVSDDGNTEDEGLTKEESEATIESEEGFNIEDYLDYIDEKGIWHLKDGTLFDPAFYKKMYGDALEIDGFVSEEDMLKHYLEYGKTEKRFANQDDYDAFTEQYEAEKRAREEEERKKREEKDQEGQQEESEEENVVDESETETETASETETETEAANATEVEQKYRIEIYNAYVVDIGDGETSESGAFEGASNEDNGFKIASITATPASQSMITQTMNVNLDTGEEIGEARYDVETITVTWSVYNGITGFDFDENEEPVPVYKTEPVTFTLTFSVQDLLDQQDMTLTQEREQVCTVNYSDDSDEGMSYTVIFKTTIELSGPIATN